MLGEDFSKARSGWLYPQEPMQGLWRGLGLALLIFIIWQLLLTISASLVFVFGFRESALAAYHQIQSSGKWRLELGGLPEQAIADMTRASVMALFPANIITAFIALGLSHFGLPKRLGRLPLSWPKIGLIGWVFLLFSFVLAMIIFFAVSGYSMGIDPNQNLGVVEKVTMEFITNPLLFALAVPGLVIGAPLVEELLFRGVLFAALIRSPLGRIGAVLVSSALWAAGHVTESSFSIAMIFVMGLALGVLLLRFGSLWVTIACHTAWNAMFVMAAYVGGGHS